MGRQRGEAGQPGRENPGAGTGDGRRVVPECAGQRGSGEEERDGEQAGAGGRGG
jgi:hypothetical protein